MNDAEAFTACVDLIDHTPQSPVIVHAPHGGTAIPPTVRADFVDGDELAAEVSAMTDHATDWLASSISGVSRVVNHLSRLVVDVERFDDDAEEMNTVGMGVLYTHGSRRQRIRELGPERRAQLIGFYRRYADAVTHLTETALDAHGRALIIDVHSYPARALPYELHADEARPQLCVGFEPLHADDRMLELVTDAFPDWQLAHNEPFHGSYVPLKYYTRDPRVQSVMLEIRRDMYLDAAGAVDETRLAGIRRGIQSIASTWSDA